MSTVVGAFDATSPLSRFVARVFGDAEGVELLAQFDSLDGMARWGMHASERKRVKLVRVYTLVGSSLPRGYRPIEEHGMVQYDGVLMIITVQSIDQMIRAYDRLVAIR